MDSIEYLVQCVTERGWFVFPLAPGSKVPLLRGSWKDRSTNDLSVIQHWYAEYPDCNWGLDCGKSGLVVLDVDGVSGDASLAGLFFEHGVRETLVHRTPNDGRHYIFKGAGASRAGVAPGLDTRSVGGYIVLPGSKLHGVDTPYSVESGCGPSEAPGWLLSLAKRNEALVKADISDVELDSEAAVREVVEYLRTAAPAIEGQGGNAATYCVACRIRDLGVTEETAIEAMIETYNPRCEPPWEEAELETIVRNAYRYASNPAPGAHSVDARAKDAALAFAHFVPSQPKPLIWYAEHDAPEREWIVKDWIPKGSVCLITGRGGTGKSGLGLQLVLACCSGKWLTHECQKLPALYVGCEDSDDELHRRLKGLFAMPEYAGVSLSSECRVWSRLGEENLIGRAIESQGKIVPGPLYHQISDYYKDRPRGASLLVLDTVADIYNGPESHRSMVNTFAKEILGGLSKRFELTIVLIGHPPKTEGDSVGAEYSGTTAWEAAVRSRIYLRYYDPERPDDHRVMKCSKANYSASGGEEVLCRNSGGGFEVVDRAKVVNLADELVYDAVVKASMNGEPLQTSKRTGLSRCIYSIGLADADGKELSKEAIDAALQRLVKTNRIEDVHGKAHGNGLVPAGME